MVFTRYITALFALTLIMLTGVFANGHEAFDRNHEDASCSICVLSGTNEDENAADENDGDDPMEPFTPVSTMGFLGEKLRTSFVCVVEQLPHAFEKLWAKIPAPPRSLKNSRAPPIQII